MLSMRNSGDILSYPQFDGHLKKGFYPCAVRGWYARLLLKGKPPMLKPPMIRANIPVLYLKEGEVFLCYSPAFDLVAHGDSFEDAERSFAQTLKLFVEQVSKKHTWEAVLAEYGWEKTRKEWSPPRIIGQESKAVDIPIPT